MAQRGSGPLSATDAAPIAAVGDSFVVAMDREPLVYGYVLVAVDDASTDVTSYCDWSGVPEVVHRFLTFPVISLDALDATLERLAAQVEPSA